MPATRVLVLYTGGTIGMVPADPDRPDGARHPGTKQELLRYLPATGTREGIEWDLLTHPDLPPVDSSDIAPRHWLAIARIVAEAYAEYDGFVILHGTDTMAYTASGLSFLLENLAKPVILTGSQTPLFHERTDGRLNLIHALRIAGCKATGIPRVPEVAICFGKRVVRGNRARKFSTTDSDAFESPNYRPIGVIETDVRIDRSALLPQPEGSLRVHDSLYPGVVDVTIFPGLEPEALSCMVAAPRVRGILLRTFGEGNLPNEPSLLEVLQSAIATGKTVVSVTQCPRGTVAMNRYESGRALLAMGVASGLDLTPEAALAKLSWLLGQDLDPAQVRIGMQTNLRGELTEE